MTTPYRPPDNLPRLPDDRNEALPPPPPGGMVRVNFLGDKPYIAYVLLGFTVFVFLLQEASLYLLNVDLPVGFGLKVNDAILQGQLWRLFTPMLLHDTSNILHIGFNMYALYVLGPNLEYYFGHGRFLGLYLLAGFAGNVASFIFSPYNSLGASTAIFGLLGAQAVFLYQNRELFGEMARRALVNSVVIALVNLAIGLAPGIDNWGHLGGLLGGTLFAWFGGPLFRVHGIYPALSLADGREPGDALRAGIGVAALFVLATAATIYFRLN